MGRGPMMGQGRGWGPMMQGRGQGWGSMMRGRQALLAPRLRQAAEKFFGGTSKMGKAPKSRERDDGDDDDRGEKDEDR